MPAWITAGAAIVGGIMSREGQEDANAQNLAISQQNSAFNAAQAQENRDFQERMSNTSYQRGVTDMKAAGLNPMLAYSQGGASSPGGTSATAAQPPAMLNKNAAGLAGAQAAAATQNTHADTELKEAQARLTEQQAEQSKATTAQTTSLTALSDNELKERMRSVEDRMKEIRFRASKMEEDANISGHQRVLASARENYAADYAKGEMKKLYAEAAKLGAEASIRELEIPAAINDALFEASKYGPYRPYLQHGGDALGKLSHSASQLRGMFGRKFSNETTTQKYPDGTSTYSRGSR